MTVETNTAETKLGAAPKTATRPGSQWAHGNRKHERKHVEPKGYARGAKIK